MENKIYKANKTKGENPGFVYLPYTFVNRTEPNKEYDDFMKEYHENHKYCPKCGETSHSTTLVGYFLNMSKKEEYKDLNRCKCENCGDVHTAHQRVKEFK